MRQRNQTLLIFSWWIRDPAQTKFALYTRQQTPKRRKLQKGQKYCKNFL